MKTKTFKLNKTDFSPSRASSAESNFDDSPEQFPPWGVVPRDLSYPPACRPRPYYKDANVVTEARIAVLMLDCTCTLLPPPPPPPPCPLCVWVMR